MEGGGIEFLALLTTAGGGIGAFGHDTFLHLWTMSANKARRGADVKGWGGSQKEGHFLQMV